MVSDRVLVSFCIPTFNRAELVKRCATKVLEIDSDRIEVLISDNASPDGTEEAVRSIGDPRISYHRNESNIGAVMNIVQTIKLAKGEWVFLLSDEDAVETRSMEKVLNDLSTKNRSGLAVIYGNVRKPDGTYYYSYKNAEYPKGDRAVLNAGFTHHYMSGIMINKEHIDTDQLDKYTLEDGMYPHINLLTRACVDGGALTMDMDFCTAGSYEGRKSFVEKPNDQFYFHPRNRFEQFKIFARLADRTIEDRDLRIKMFERLYFEYLGLATFLWEDVIKTESIRDHFGVDKGIKFDFRAELKNFDSKAKAFFKEMIEDPLMREDLDRAISKRMYRFRLKRVYRSMPGPVRRMVLFLYKRTKKK